MSVSIFQCYILCCLFFFHGNFMYIISFISSIHNFFFYFFKALPKRYFFFIQCYFGWAVFGLLGYIWDVFCVYDDVVSFSGFLMRENCENVWYFVRNVGKFAFCKLIGEFYSLKTIEPIKSVPHRTKVLVQMILYSLK